MLPWVRPATSIPSFFNSSCLRGQHIELFTAHRKIAFRREHLGARLATHLFLNGTALVSLLATHRDSGMQIERRRRDVSRNRQPLPAP